MAKHLVISTSGNPDSNSRRMGRAAFVHLQKKKIDCDWVDIREMDLPLCDADKCYGMPGSKKLLCDLRVLRGELRVMKITKNIGMLLLAIYLILDGLLGFGLNLGPAIFLLYLVALAAGVLILIGK